MQINKFFLTFFIITIPTLCSISINTNKEFILILDPAGDAKKTGRAIGDSFERGLTLQCTEKIKSIIEQRCSYIKTIITRLPGDIVYELQNASLANRINADLFININFYLSQDTKPTLFLYQFSYGNDFAPHQPILTFTTYDQAYKINKYSTDSLINTFSEQLNCDAYKNLFSVSGPHSLPIKPLIGIASPSICLEIGLKNKDSWQLFVDPIVETIITTIEQHKKNS